MHTIQQKLLNLSHEQDLGKMSLRQIAKLIGQDNKPQLVKHHLFQLEKMGMIRINMAQGVIKPIKRGFGSTSVNSHIYSLPIVGAANCGDARIFAEERIEGHLRVAASMLPRKRNGLYVLIADGSSMNMADVGNGKTIEDGDFVIVDGLYKSPKDGDIIVSVIDGMANLKRFTADKASRQITLQSESTENHLPIFINEGDDFVVSGKVIDVIKKPK